MKNKVSVLSSGVVASFCLCQPLMGQVLMGNYGESGPANDGSGTGITGTSWRAAGFTTGGQAVTIESVNLRLRGYEVGDDPEIGFFTDVAGTPGALIPGTSFLIDPSPASGTDPTPEGDATFTFLPASTITLAAS